MGASCLAMQPKSMLMSEQITSPPDIKNKKPGLVGYLLQHIQSLVFSLGQLWKKPFNTLLTCSVIGIALTLPTGFYVLLHNAERLTQNWDASIEVSAFLKPNIDQTIKDELIDELKTLKLVNDIIYMSEQDALEEYKSLSGFSNALDMLEENPLPAVLLIDIDNESKSIDSLDSFIKELETNEMIDTVVLDRQWLLRLQQIVEIIRKGVYIISALLAVGVLLIVGNTIRLNINNKRQEIEIIKLFGGTNGFIQRPFLYAGFWYGFIGSVIAVVFVGVSLILLMPSINHLAGLYSDTIDIAYLNILEIASLILIGSFLGLFGSWISVEQHIRQIEPQ